VHLIDLIIQFFNKKLSKDKKTNFIQFITLGLFGGVAVITYIPKNTDPITIISAIVIFWMILYVIFRLFQYFKIL
tara:strand:- start:3772 stop:3996 length:225 start_codon:yes stop_codon:yes gene_type:complete